MTALKDLDPASSPRAFFGADLRRRRIDAGLTQQELGEQICYTASLVGLVEHALRVPSHDLAKLCDDALSADGALLRLWDLVDRCASGPTTPEHLTDLEADAQEIRTFGALRIPWTLQTPDYARALLAARGDRPTTTAVDQAVAAIAARQTTIADTPSWVVLDESVLHRRIGGHDTMLTQLRHIADLAARPTITVQVVPLDTGEYPGLDGDITLLSLPEGWNIGYTDGYTTYCIESQDALTSCAHAFDLIRATALPPKQSLALITSIADAGEFVRSWPAAERPRHADARRGTRAVLGAAPDMSGPDGPVR